MCLQFCKYLKLYFKTIFSFFLEILLLNFLVLLIFFFFWYTKVSGWVFVFGGTFSKVFFYSFSKALCVESVVLHDVWFHSCLCSSIKSVSFGWCKKNIIIILLEIKHLSWQKHINKNFTDFFWEKNFKIYKENFKMKIKY